MSRNFLPAILLLAAAMSVAACGNVLNELDRQQVAENTFVLFISDNGAPFPRAKTTVYDSGVRTPWIVRPRSLTWPA